jgi:hypothetical protein
MAGGWEEGQYFGEDKMPPEKSGVPDVSLT